MKRIEVVVRNNRLNNVITALIEANVSGYTVTQSSGRGAGARSIVKGAEGVTQYTDHFNSGSTIFTIVHDSLVDSIVSAIADAVHTGVSGDGKIIVTNVEKLVDIRNKTKDEQAI